MSVSVGLQVWALMRRYIISQLRTPCQFGTRVLIWPAFIIGINIFILLNFKKIGLDIVGFESQLPFLLWMATVNHFYHFVNWHATDREFGMKSLLLSMGLRRISYFLANSICVILTVLPIIVSLISISLIFIFTESQASSFEIALVFIMFVLHFNAWMHVFSSIITSSKYSSLSIVILVLQLLVHQGILKAAANVSEPYRWMILFLGSISPFESVAIFCDSYTVCKNCNETQVVGDGAHASQPVWLVLVATMVWTLVGHAFARWFEEVCPWQDDADVRSPFFCFENLFCESKRRSHLDDQPDSIHRDPRVFEPSLNERETGIKINKITKSFKSIPVVSDLSFNIYQGETTLLLGHNGAGKTTLMNMILGRLIPDSGNVKFKSSASVSGLSSVGVCPQASVLDKCLNVRQHLELIADIKNCKMPSHQKFLHINTTIEDVSLMPHVDKLPEQLSGGMKRKLSLAMAFVGQSPVLILDEPSSGLDPDSRVFIWNAIRKYRADRTVLLSTQHMEEADYLGDRIAIMNAGRIVCCGSSTFLTKAFGTGYKLRIECQPEKKHEILALIRQHFRSAKTEDDGMTSTPMDNKKKPTVDMVVKLGDGESQDLEVKMIALLEHIESQSNYLGIKSHGLKSSSLEDVFLSTGKHFSLGQSEATSHSHTALKLANTSDHIQNLTRPQMRRPGSKSTSILYALLVKSLHAYRRDWIGLFTYRVAVQALLLLLLALQYGTELLRAQEFMPQLYISMIVMHYIYYPTAERVSKFKAVQLTSNANYLVYWTSQLITDLPTALIGVILVNIMYKFAANIIMLESSLKFHLMLSAAMFMLHISSALFAYVISTMFKEASVGLFCMILGSSYIVNRVMILVQALVSRDLSWLIRTLLRISTVILPVDAYQYIIYGLGAECYVKSGYFGNCEEQKDFIIPPIIYGFASLVIQIICYGLLLYLVEKNNLELRYYLNPMNCFRSDQSIKNEMRQVDEDVQNETAKAKSLIGNVSTETHSLVAADLQKSYVKGQRVIENLSFTVERGECFGLLGINGAGKSTTFSMIAAEIKPDAGRIWLNGNYNNEDIDKYRRMLGYGPQSNPEISLSPTEALYLMARLRNVSEQEIPTLVTSALEVLDMVEHSHKTVNSLSGGNKRKLALGMAFIGNPSLLTLDEPTAGVDPIARRGIWQLLKSLRSQSGVSVVISSHAMEECEAICDRISIMAHGKLRCIGSFLHLRSKFSLGCSIRIQFSTTKDSQISRREGSPEWVSPQLEANQVAINELRDKLESVLGSGVKLVDSNINSATFNISDDRVKRSALFKILREARQKHPNLSYMINDSSLEDIFIKLAREQLGGETN